ncbi:Protein SYM1 [Seminavis robusta]|uniref:Protein SYM1 n=1 Tax=Seminavis robusta TaxID=568900 RepID=A0A9N8DBE6_9STRA|nr:Protein SYM1 [Seminavis robusta]|eukprot:Sro43_g026320.1 Protein SYM1 (220) ;mRNA; r:120247-120906
MTGLLQGAMDAYSVALEERPVLTDMCTSGFLWFLGDLATQWIEQCNEKKKKKMDWKRTVNQMAYASVVWAPIAHKWYILLDRLVHMLLSMETTPTKLVFTKLLLEILILHPVSLLTYFSVLGIMSGDSLKSIKQQLCDDFWPTYGLEICMWTPLDVGNFALVPVRHQLLVVNCGCLVESTVLSFIKNNGFQQMMSQSLAFLPGKGDQTIADKKSKEKIS